MPSRSFSRILGLSLTLLGTAGCDQLAADLFTFPVDGVRFTFAFQGDEVAGAQATISADAVENILGELADRGFDAASVSRVQLVAGSAQVRILQAPAGVDIGFLDDVALRLEGGGASAVVASAENVESGSAMVNEAVLDVSPENVAGIVTAGDFDAQLTVSADADTPDGAYRLEVGFDLEVGVF